MRGRVLKDLFTKNIILKLLAVALATALWVVARSGLVR